MNRIEQLHLAVDQAVTVVSSIRGHQRVVPTPFTPLDVDQLVRHLVVAVRRAELIGRGVHPSTTPSHEPPPGAWPLGTALVEAGAAAVEAWWAADLSTERVLPFATLAAREALDLSLFELAVHTWDLAVATGQPAEGDPELGGILLTRALVLLPALSASACAGHLPTTRRTTHPAPTAGPTTRLAALLGRDTRSVMGVQVA